MCMNSQKRLIRKVLKLLSKNKWKEKKHQKRRKFKDEKGLRKISRFHLNSLIVLQTMSSNKQSKVKRMDTSKLHLNSKIKLRMLKLQIWKIKKLVISENPLNLQEEKDPKIKEEMPLWTTQIFSSLTKQMLKKQPLMNWLENQLVKKDSGHILVQHIRTDLNHQEEIALLTLHIQKLKL